MKNDDVVKTYFYHPVQAPSGEMFDMSPDPDVYLEQRFALEAEGWVDSPAKFDNIPAAVPAKVAAVAPTKTTGKKKG